MGRKKKNEEVVEPTCAENAQVEKTKEEMFEELNALNAEIFQQEIAEEKAKVVEEVETPVSDADVFDEYFSDDSSIENVEKILCGDYVETEELISGKCKECYADDKTPADIDCEECNNDKSAKFIDELYKILDRNVSLDYQFVKMKNEILDLIKKFK